MTNNFDNPNLLMNPGSLIGARLNSDELAILVYIAGQCSICSADDKNGGQTTNSSFEYYLEKEENFDSATIKKAIAKLKKHNVIKFYKKDNIYQINPSCIWIPSNVDEPTAYDKYSFEQLKYKFPTK